MATAIHVQGPAILYTGYALWTDLLPNIAGAEGEDLDDPGQLGISEDGVDISINYYDEPVISDAGGPNCPIDLQDMGQTAEISARLVVYDLALLKVLRQRASGTAGTFAAEGALPPMGTLIYSNGFANRLIIDGADEIFRFWCVKLRGAVPTKVGTKRTIWNLRFFAWTPICTETSAEGLVLYDHTNA